MRIEDFKNQRALRREMIHPIFILLVSGIVLFILYYFISPRLVAMTAEELRKIPPAPTAGSAAWFQKGLFHFYGFLGSEAGMLTTIGVCCAVM